jgi:hypothetical protein
MEKPFSSSKLKKSRRKVLESILAPPYSNWIKSTKSLFKNSPRLNSTLMSCPSVFIFIRWIFSMDFFLI